MIRCAMTAAEIQKQNVQIAFTLIYASMRGINTYVSFFSLVYLVRTVLRFIRLLFARVCR
jgi:hypothetical protein